MSILMAALCAALLTLAAGAQPRDDPRFDAEVAAPRVPTLLREAAGSAPPDVTTLIVVRGLASLRHADASRAMLGMMRRLDLFPASRGAWNALARQLGMTPERAFDELLGEHVVFMSRDEPEADARSAPAWALRSRVSLASAKRLGVALGATPRADLGGLPVFSLEQGGFVLHIRADKRDQSAWITIGPGNRTALFRHVLDPPAHARALADDASFADLIAALPETGDAFVYRRLAPGSPEFAVGSVRVVKSSLAATYAAHGAPDTRPAPEGWSRDALTALGDQGALTILESGPSSAGRLLETTGALAALGPVRGLAALFDPFQPRALLGDRGGLLLRRSLSGGFGIAYSVSTPDCAALAPEADRYMAEQLAALFPSDARFDPRKRLDMSGLAPEAMRTVSLRDTGVGGLFRDQEHATFAWMCAPALDGAGTDAPAPGWWVAGLDPHTVERTAKALASSDSTGEWAMLGDIRPRELVALLDAAARLPIPDAHADLMRGIERVTVSERRVSPAKVVGSFSVEFAPAPPAPGG